MFDLSRLAKALPGTQEIPCLCVRVLDGELDSAACQGISIAASVLGAAGFVNLHQWRREYGFDQAREKLRHLVSSLTANRD